MRRALLCALGAALAAAGSGPRAEAVDLIGTWHVLVHYKDSATSHPERERWEDRIWEFAREGDRLRWTDYPIVVFEDQSGRFEKLGGNRAARVLQFWEPNPNQLAQIRQGLEVNPRGSRTKTLRGSAEKGWSSGTAAPRYQSARFLTFTETWTIQGLPAAPVFVRDDVMGSAVTESFQGRTLYETEAVEEGGDMLRGRYDRDGTRIGTFRMMRSGSARTVKGSGKSAGERVYEAFFAELGAQLYRGEMPGGGSEEELRAAVDAGEFTEDDRRELRVQFEQAIAAEYERQGNDARALRPQIQSLARKMTALFVDDGKNIEEIRKMIQDGSLRP